MGALQNTVTDLAQWVGLILLAVVVGVQELTRKCCVRRMTQKDLQYIIEEVERNRSSMNEPRRSEVTEHSGISLHVTHNEGQERN